MFSSYCYFVCTRVPCLYFGGLCYDKTAKYFCKTNSNASFYTVPASSYFLLQGWAPQLQCCLSLSRCHAPRQLSYRWALLAKGQRPNQGEGGKKRASFPPILETMSTSLSEPSWTQRNKIWYFFWFCFENRTVDLKYFPETVWQITGLWFPGRKPPFMVNLKDFWEEQLGKDLIPA